MRTKSERNAFVILLAGCLWFAATRVGGSPPQMSGGDRVGQESSPVAVRAGDISKPDGLRVSSGGVPLEINHQGVISVKGGRFTGTGLFWFAIIDPDSGNNVWTNDGTNVGVPNRPTSSVSLPVNDGIYSVRLGDTTLTAMTAIPTVVFKDDNLRLRIWFNDDAGGGTHMLAPDQVLTASPYAFTAAFAPGVVPIGSIVAWHKNLSGVPTLSQDWVECTNPNGTTVINVPGSPLNGQLIPDLNTSVPSAGGGRFLRGSNTSGALQADEFRSHSHPAGSPYDLAKFLYYHGPNFPSPVGPIDSLFMDPSENYPSRYFSYSDATGLSGGAETRPVNMSVVWIMRVK